MERQDHDRRRRLAGLTAAIACAEGGRRCGCWRRTSELGGRARSTDGPYKANLGPHVIYKDGPFWAWLSERDLLPPSPGRRSAGIRFRWHGEIRRTPPLALDPAGAAAARPRGAGRRSLPRVGRATTADERTAAMLSRGRRRLHLPPRPRRALGRVRLGAHRPRRCSARRRPPRYLDRRLERARRRARGAGAGARASRSRPGERVDALPEPPAIVATELADARQLLGDDSLGWPSGHTVCIDLGLRHRRGDPFVVSDLDEAGWIERFTAARPLAGPGRRGAGPGADAGPPGESAERPPRASSACSTRRFADWRERETWRRRQVMDGRTGALDMPGTTWRDRPAVDRGDGVFLAGDMVAAPGCSPRSPGPARSRRAGSRSAPPAGGPTPRGGWRRRGVPAGAGAVRRARVAAPPPAADITREGVPHVCCAERYSGAAPPSARQLERSLALVRVGARSGPTALTLLDASRSRGARQRRRAHGCHDQLRSGDVQGPVPPDLESRAVEDDVGRRAATTPRRRFRAPTTPRRSRPPNGPASANRSPRTARLTNRARRRRPGSARSTPDQADPVRARARRLRRNRVRRTPRRRGRR